MYFKRSIFSPFSLGEISQNHNFFLNDNWFIRRLPHRKTREKEDKYIIFTSSDLDKKLNSHVVKDKEVIS